MAPPGAARTQGALSPSVPPKEDRGVEAPEGELWFQRRRVLLWGGSIGGVSLLGLLIAGWALTRSPDALPPAPAAPAVAATTPSAEATSQARLREVEAAGREKIEKYRARTSEVPEELLALRSELGLHVPLRELEAQYQELLEEVERRMAKAADQIFRETLKRTQEYQKEQKFSAAGELWKDMPEIVRRSDRRASWVEEEEKASRYALAWALWTKIDEKADKYLGQDDPDIAIAILECEENYPAHCQTNYPLIWARREERLGGLKVNAESERLARAERALKRRREEEEAERIRQEREREERWAAALEKTPWVPLISREGGDLENWTHRTVIYGESIFDAKLPWSLETVGGRPVLSANNSGHEEEIEIGVNGNRWMDWVLEFDVLVEAEKLRLRTRTMLQKGGPDPTVCSTSVVEAAPKDFEFPAQSYGSWTRIRIEARGKKVIVLEGGEKKDEVETPDNPTGGFVFVLVPDGAAKIRDVQLKLIYQKKETDEEE